MKSKTSKRNIEKDDGAKLIYTENGWKVYKITTYKAAQIYGRNTKWCITGNYDGHEEEGEGFFNDYINDYNLDGGYYFFIKSNNEKYCVLKSRSGRVVSIWDITDKMVGKDDPTLDEMEELLPSDFPAMKDVFPDFRPSDRPTLDKADRLLFSDDLNKVHRGIELGGNLGYRLDGFTPFETAIKNKNIPVAVLLLDAGSNYPHEDTSWYYITDAESIRVLRISGVDFTTISIFMHEPYLFSLLTNKDLTIDAVKELVDSCNVKAFAMYDNSSTLKRAIKLKDANIFKFLLDNCNADQINKRYPDGSTLLHYAVKRKTPIAKLKMLLDAGADPNIKDKDGNLPADLTINNRIVDLINQY